MCVMILRGAVLDMVSRHTPPQGRRLQQLAQKCSSEKGELQQL
jgi:hypothetical protein